MQADDIEEEEEEDLDDSNSAFEKASHTSSSRGGLSTRPTSSLSSLSTSKKWIGIYKVRVVEVVWIVKKTIFWI